MTTHPGSQAEERTEAEEPVPPAASVSESEGWRFLYEVLRDTSVAPLFKVLGNGILAVTIFFGCWLAFAGILTVGQQGGVKNLWEGLSRCLRFFALGMFLSAVGEVLMYLRKIAER